MKITVHGTKEYDILIEDGLLECAGSAIAKAVPGAGKLCIVWDRIVYRLFGGESSPLQRSLESSGFKVFTQIIQGGEINKNISSVNLLTDFLAENQFTRSDVIISIGGGIAGDISGFASSIYMRGIRYIQIPTSLLAMADSSIGGKTGVNTEAGKNMIGTFWPPELVIIDPSFLKTLPKKQLLNGLSEIIKAGFIGDDTIFDSISEGIVPSMVKAIEVKRKIVEKDELESDKRRLLNFGHTIGHSIEKCSGYRIPHGYAVMTGMYITALAAEESGWTKKPTSGYIKTVIDAFGYPVISKYSAEELAAVALSDKKSDGDNITIVYPLHPGRMNLKAIPKKELKSFIGFGLEKARK